MYIIRHILFSAVALFSLHAVMFAMQQSTQGLYHDTSILSATTGTLVISFRPDGLRRDTLYIDGERYIGIGFRDGATADRRDPERPDVPFRPVTIALPSAGMPALRVTQTDYELVRELRIPPLGDIRSEDDELYRSVREYSLSDISDQPLVDMTDIGEVGGVYLGTLRFHPVVPVEGGSAARVYSRIVVEIEYGTGSFGSLEPQLYDVLSGVVLNIGSVIRTAGRSGVLQRQRSGSGSQSSELATGMWYSFTVEEDGIYRIDAAMLQQAGIPVGSIDPRTIRVFGNGGEVLPENITQPRPEGLTELAIYVQGEGDGTFGTNDFILFYGTGTTGWSYDPPTELYHHRYNYYSNRNVYFLTYGGQPGKRMTELASLSEVNPVTPEYFISQLLVREPEINLLGSGKHWMGQLFNQQANTNIFTNMLHGFTSAEAVRYRVSVAARAPSVTRFTLEDQGVQLGIIPIPATFISSNTSNYAQRGAVGLFSRSGQLPEQRSLLRFIYDGGTSSDGYLEWFEIHYPRRYEAVGDVLLFRAPMTGGTVEYTVGSFSTTQLLAFDVSDHANVRRITGGSTSGGSLRFQVSQAEGEERSFISIGPEGYKAPSDFTPVTNSNIRGMTGGPEFIIIAPPEFISEAERLRQHRETFADNSVSTVVVSTTAIYNEFGGGIEDPTAIRDFLYHAYTAWDPRPRYVLLFGAGSFDFRRTLGLRQNFVHTYQTDESFHQIDTYATDDYFAQFTQGSRRPSLAVGRFSVSSVTEAQQMVDKVIHYERSSDFGPWRNSITYVADDGPTTRGQDDGNIHTFQSEQLVNRHTPLEFERQKIYIVEYPTETTAAGRRKPEANRALVNRINEGTLILNWTGHGNPRVWAHEWIFVRESTIPQLNNRDRLAFLTAATCDFSRYDDPRDVSGAELLVNRPEGGMIGALSSSRIVWSSDNALFNNTFYGNLLQTGSDGRIQRVGDALLATKQLRFSINDVKFLLLGDPTLRLLAPTMNADISMINDEPVSGTVNLKSLQKVQMQGLTRSTQGELLENFDGRLFVVVFDSDKLVRIPEWGNYSYNVPGNVIFRGESSVTDGSFSSTFVVPKDISHEGRNGRIALYFSDGQNDGRGYNGDIVLGGIDSTAAEDTQGPEIEIFLEGRNFRSGDVVSTSPLLLVDLFDESGINTSGGGVGHRLEAWLNEGENIDLTNYYSGKIDSYQEGTIEYRLSDLSYGPHHLQLRAWDVYNNSAMSEVFFHVESADRLSIQNAYNYPNPFRDETVFTFQHNQNVPLDVEVKVYTVSGRLIATVNAYGINDRFVRVPWSGRDDDGDVLANGVYLYKIVARTIDGIFTSEALGRMAVVR